MLLCHAPPRAVRTPRSFSASAMFCRPLTPAAWICRTIVRGEGGAPATAGLIQKMRDICPESMIGKRDRALLAFGSTREVVMWYWYSAVATAAVLLSGFGATAGELPTYETMGLPVTQHQLMAVNSAYVRERSPIPTLTLGGMPASPVQILVLTPHPKEEIAAEGGPDGSPPTVTP